jgi:FtsH-binding integral membrane protein
LRRLGLGSEADHEGAINSALIVYLDSINLLLFLLRIFGRRK